MCLRARVLKTSEKITVNYRPVNANVASVDSRYKDYASQKSSARFRQFLQTYRDAIIIHAQTLKPRTLNRETLYFHPPVAIRIELISPKLKPPCNTKTRDGNSSCKVCVHVDRNGIKQRARIKNNKHDGTHPPDTNFHARKIQSRFPGFLIVTIYKISFTSEK